MNKLRRCTQINDSLYIQWIDTNSLFDMKKPKVTITDTKYKFLWVKSNIIMSTMKENNPIMHQVINLMFGVSWEVIKIWLNDVFDIMKSVIHGTLIRGPNIL